MKKIRLLVSFLLLLKLASAQTNFVLNGSVSDNKTGETLLGATVLIEGTTIGTATNEYGFFSLKIPQGTYNIVVSSLGYTSFRQTVELTQNVRLNVNLEEMQTELDEVVITADTEQISIASPEMSTNKLQIETIKSMPVVFGEVDVIKSIQLLPGVSGGGEGSGGFNVRGGAADQNLILLDEGVIFNSSHLFGFFSVFNPDAIKSLKLYKGGIPAKFGGRISSVLDIRQKDGNKKEFHASGGISTISSRLMLEGPIQKEKGSFLVAGRGSYGHLFLKLAGEDNSAYFYDLNMKGHYELGEKDQLFLSGYFGRDVFEIGDFSNTYGNVTGNLRWNHVFSENLFSNLSFIYSDYKYMLDVGQGFEWESNIENYNLRYDFLHNLSQSLSLNYGLGALYYKFNPGEIIPNSLGSAVNYQKLDEKYAFEPSLYLEAEQKITPQLTARYGVRYSHFSRLGPQTVTNYANNQAVVYNPILGVYESGTKTGETSYKKGKVMQSYGGFEPRVSLSFRFDDSNSLKASFNTMQQYIHLVSNTSSPTPLDIWTPSGDFIEPQKGQQYALGYFKKITGYTFDTELYYKTVDNRMDYIDGAELIANNNIETEILPGESRAYGLELMVKKTSGKLRGWMSYTLAKSEQRVTGRNEQESGINNGEWYRSNYDRLHDLSLTGSYSLNEKWSFGANFIYQTGRPATYPVGQYSYQGVSVPLYGERNSNNLPDYHHLDISATLTPRKNNNRKWHSEWVFSVYNLYGRKNAYSLSFGANENSGINEASRLSIFGIIPSVTYNFKF